MTTIGGFAVLVLSSLPLLRDFGIIVTLNVAIALLSALIVMPSLSIWVDERGWLGTNDAEAAPFGAVVLASSRRGPQAIVALISAVLLLVGAIAVYSSADTSVGASSGVAYAAVPLPTTTTTTTTTTAPVDDAPLIDPSTFGDTRPESLIGGTLFDLMIGQDVEPNVANCVIETLGTLVTDDELIALGIVSAEPEAVLPVIAAADVCGVGSDVVDAALATFLGG